MIFCSERHDDRRRDFKPLFSSWTVSLTEMKMRERGSKSEREIEQARKKDGFISVFARLLRKMQFASN